MRIRKKAAVGLSVAVLSLTAMACESGGTEAPEEAPAGGTPAPTAPATGAPLPTPS